MLEVGRETGIPRRSTIAAASNRFEREECRLRVHNLRRAETGVFQPPAEAFST